MYSFGFRGGLSVYYTSFIIFKFFDSSDDFWEGTFLTITQQSFICHPFLF